MMWLLALSHVNDARSRFTRSSAILISGVIIEKLMWDSAGKELKDGNIINAISLVSRK